MIKKEKKEKKEEGEEGESCFFSLLFSPRGMFTRRDTADQI